jgi:hypothetical protein
MMMTDRLDDAPRMDRRTFVSGIGVTLASIVCPAPVTSALASAKAAVGTVTADPSATSVPGPIRLFVEDGFGDALSLDMPFEHEEPRIW